MSQRDPGTTGNFEICVEGKLVHSKQAGQGFLDSQEKKTALYEEIYDKLSPVDAADRPLLHDGQIQVKKSTDLEAGDGDKEVDQANRRSLCVSIFTLLISIPALVGA